MITVEIKNMSTRDRIILMEEIWATLRHDENEIESPSWHEDILDKRRKQVENGEAKLISIDDLKASER
ncbi:MAG: addiction module protein [bacterium]|nr:addiction module protein [bacterium]